MTEEEAKTKWCPFVRVGLRNEPEPDQFTPPSIAYNRMEFQGHTDRGIYSDGSEGECRCIASACMAWRENDTVYNDEGVPIWAPNRLGYCGLAGKP